jgi:IS30 family transposase
LFSTIKNKMGHLKLEQRYAISAYLKCGKTKSFIADELGVDRSTIYRELKRNCRKSGIYHPGFAQELSEEKIERFCNNRRFDDIKIKLVEGWMQTEQWSPEQIKAIVISQE